MPSTTELQRWRKCAVSASMHFQLRIGSPCFHQLLAEEVLRGTRLALDVVTVQEHGVEDHLVHFLDHLGRYLRGDAEPSNELRKRLRYHLA